MAALLPPNVDYTSKDFLALRLRLQGLIRSVFPDWTDFNVTTFGNILLESFAYVGDTATFYQDKQAREAFWPTVTQRVNAIRLGRLINFRLASAQPATSTARFSLPSVAAKAVPIPLGTRLRTPDVTTLRFRTTAVAEIGIGQQSVDVPIEQAVLISTDTFTSTGAPNQRFTTSQAPYIDGTGVITAEDGAYLEVQSFLDPDPLTGDAIDENSRVYVAFSDAFDRGVFVFGNGKVGKIPEGDVDSEYKIGGGAAGNVDTDQVKIIEDQLVDTDSTVQPVSVTNTVPASGGQNRVTVLQARAQGPASLKVLERSVTKEDFEIAAEEVAGVAAAVMVTSNEDATVQENEGVLVCVAKGELLDSGRVAPAVPSAAVLADVLTKVTVEKPPPLTFSVTTAASPFFTINVSTRVFLGAGVSDPTTVGDAVRNAVRDYFAVLLEDGTKNPAIDFGANITQADGTVVSEIAWSNVFNAIRDTEDVRKVDEGNQGLLLNNLRQSVQLNPREFPVVGTITVIDADTGAAI